MMNSTFFLLRGKIWPSFLMSLFLLWGMGQNVAMAEVPLESESAYAQVLGDFHGNNFSSCVSGANKLLKKHKKNKSLLEIKALCLKRSGKLKKAVKILRALRKANPKKGSYNFALGSIFFQQGKHELAKKLLKRSLKRGFNSNSSHYFLGAIAYKKEDWKKAQKHFERVVRSKSSPFYGTASFYLGDIKIKEGNSEKAKSYYQKARSHANAVLSNDESSPYLRDASQHILAATGTSVMAADGASIGKWFGNVALVATYDSNVLFVSSEVSSPSEGASGRGSAKQLLLAGIGYNHRLNDKTQLISVYAGGFNYNFNRATSAGEYINNALDFYLNRNAEGFNYGFKAGLIGNLRNTTSASTGVQNFRAYNLNGSVGPYVRLPMGNWELKTDLFFQPLRYFQDTEVTQRFRRSGVQWQLRAFYQRKERVGFFNPGFFLKILITNPNGTEFKGREIFFEMNNRYKISKKTDLIVRAQVGFSLFPDREGASRQDWTLVGAIQYRTQIFKDGYFLAFFDYTKTFSNIEKPYAYNRYQLALGVNYLF